MSDTSTAVPPDAGAPPAAAPGVADALAGQQAPVAPDAGGAPPADYKAYWEQEKAERIRERNLYKPAQRILEGLDPDQLSALQGLAEMTRAGDAQGIVEWALATAQNVSGNDLASLVAARQQNPYGQQQPQFPQQQMPQGQFPGQQFPQQGQFSQQPFPQQGQQVPQVPGGFNLGQQQPPDVAELVTQKIAEVMAVNEAKAQVRSELQAAGYTPEDPFGQAIIRHAMQTGVRIPEAAAWLSEQLAARAALQQQALAAAGAAVPPPAVNGAPAGAQPTGEMTPKQSAIARLTAGRNGS